MANKKVRDGDFLRDENGGACFSLGRAEDKNKCYAVIVRCGHCGDGYYIPIMFTTKAINVKSAIEDIKMTPKVKRDKVYCVLDAFEISELEKFIIDAVNDHDDYLKGYVEEDSWRMEDRRIAMVFDDGMNVKTADEYHYYDVLARAFAPRRVGSELIVPTRINRKELLQEFFRCAAIRYGYKREDPFFPMLYYMQYGEDNDMGIRLKNNTISFDFKNESFNYPVSEKVLKYFERFGVSEQAKKKEEYFSGKYDDVKVPSAIDKFKARMDRFKKYQEEASRKATESQMGE